MATFIVSKVVAERGGEGRMGVSARYDIGDKQALPPSCQDKPLRHGELRRTQQSLRCVSKSFRNRDITQGR